MNSMPVTKARSWSQSLLLFVGDDPMDPQLGVLDANLGHVQRDVTEIKNDQRRTNDRLDEMNGRLDVLRDKVDQVGADGIKRIDTLNDRMTDTRIGLTTLIEATRKDLSAEIGSVRKELGQEIDTLRKDLSTEIGAVRKDLNTEIGAVRKELSAVKVSVEAMKVWTLKLQLSIGILLLGVMAHGFKWI